MAVTIQGANDYIASYVIDNVDWVKAKDDKKTRILNAASRTLEDRYPDYEIPDEAVYEFAATLAIVFNDTNRLQTQGIAGFSVTGVGSFTFKENNVRNAGGQALEDYIPPVCLSLIGKANGVELDYRLVKDVII